MQKREVYNNKETIGVRIVRKAAAWSSSLRDKNLLKKSVHTTLFPS
jgi:hypothetical protein